MWDNCTQNEADELEKKKKKKKKKQIEVARIVTGATKLVFLNLLYCETGWDTLACRRNKHKIIMFHKMYMGLSPPFLSALLPATVGANVSYNLRNPNIFEQYNATLSYIIILFFQVLYELGMASQRIQEISIVQRLLNIKLNNNLNPPLRYYNEGKRFAQILHSRLRTKCSSLNQHLYSKNIVQRSLCA